MVGRCVAKKKNYYSLGKRKKVFYINLYVIPVAESTSKGRVVIGCLGVIANCHKRTMEKHAGMIVIEQAQITGIYAIVILSTNNVH